MSNENINTELEKAKLAEAVELVNKEIEKERKRLQDILDGDDRQSPVVVEGETFEDYYCQLMVNPKEVAKIMLRHDYPTWKVLGEDAPDGMWGDMGKKFGIKVVCGVDL